MSADDRTHDLCNSIAKLIYPHNNDTFVRRELHALLLALAGEIKRDALEP